MKIVFSDFDGTLTNSGKLGAIFFDILSIVKNESSEFIIVSGRSLSWGHFLLTHFDLNFCIMEGGGVLLYKNKNGEICEKVLVTEKGLEHLEKMTEELIESVPEVILSADSFGRKTDRAIEFSLMSKEAVAKTESFFIENKLNFSKSNVHINYWAEDISKFKGIQYLIKTHFSHVDIDETIFYGDAKNDESVFEKLQNTVGVSNIIKVLDDLQFRPRIILKGKENIGALGVYQHLKEVFEQSVDF